MATCTCFAVITALVTIFLIAAPASCQQPPIILGATVPLSNTPAASTGIMLQAGFELALAEANRQSIRGGALANRNVTLLALDDEYNYTKTVENLQYLISRNDILAIIGGTTTGTAAAIQIMNATLGGPKMPIVGATTGANEFRDPFQRNLINIRASNTDEIAAAVSYFTSTQLISRIAIVYQDDPYGHSGREALYELLPRVGLRVVAEGKIPRDTIDVLPAIANLSAPDAAPELVLLWTRPDQAIAVIIATARLGTPANVTFCVSSLATLFLIEYLTIGPNSTVDYTGRGVYTTSLFPPADPNSKSEVVRRMFESIVANGTNGTFIPDFFYAIEGYLSGLFVTSVLSRMTGVAVTREAFIDAVYSSPLTVIDDVRIGPYSDDCNIEGVFGCCNQGMRTVYISKINATARAWQLAPLNSVFSWEGCQAATTLIRVPITLGETAAADNAERADFRRGVYAAFHRKNSDGGLNGRSLYLTQYDDGGNPETALKYADELINKNQVFMMLGNPDPDISATVLDMATKANIPFLGGNLGSAFLRAPYTPNVLNLRASYKDQLAAAVKFLVSTSAQRIAVIASGYFRYNASADGYDYDFEPLAKEAIKGYGGRFAGFGRRYDDIADSNADAIIIAAAAGDVATALSAAAADSLPASVAVAAIVEDGVDMLLRRLADDGVPVSRPLFLVSVVPNPFDVDTTLAAADNMIAEYRTAVAEYLQSIGVDEKPVRYSFASLEGYLTARFAVQAMELINGEITPSRFLQSVYSASVFSLGSVGEQQLFAGPFTNSCAADARARGDTPAAVRDAARSYSAKGSGCCNQGMNTVFIVRVNSSYGVESQPFDFSFQGTCGVYIAPSQKTSSASDSNEELIAIVVPVVVGSFALLVGVIIVLAIVAIRNRRGTARRKLIEPNYRELALRPLKEHEEAMSSNPATHAMPLLVRGGEAGGGTGPAGKKFKSVKQLMGEFSRIVLNSEHVDLIVRVLKAEGVETRELAHCFTCIYSAPDVVSDSPLDTRALNELVTTFIDYEIANAAAGGSLVLDVRPRGNTVGSTNDPSAPRPRAGTLGGGGVPTANVPTNSAAATLFRQDSFLSYTYKLMTRLVGLPYIWRALAELVAELEDLANSTKKRRRDNGSGSASFSGTGTGTGGTGGSVASHDIFSLEVDPTRMQQTENALLNILQLKLYCQKFFLAINSTRHMFPPELREFMTTLRRKLEAQGVVDRQLYPLLGSFVFLRYLCVAITCPNQYGLLKDPPSESVQRFLILVSKVLQNLSNLAIFEKEAYMMPLNDFLQENFYEVRGLFDYLSTMPETSTANGEVSVPLGNQVAIPPAMREACLKRLFSYMSEYKTSLLTAIHAEEAPVHKELEEFLGLIV